MNELTESQREAIAERIGLAAFPPEAQCAPRYAAHFVIALLVEHACAIAASNKVFDLGAGHVHRMRERVLAAMGAYSREVGERN